MELRLDSPIQYVPRVGPNMAGKLRKRLGLETVQDLLFHVPFRYEDYSIISPIGRLRPGETVTIIGALEYIRTFVTKNGKRMVMGRLTDDSGSIDLLWFNQQYLVKVLRQGDTLSVSGKADWFSRKIAIISPVYEKLDTSDSQASSLHTGRLVPIYPETEGVSSKWMRGRIHYIIHNCLSDLPDPLPENIIREEQLLPLAEALQAVHFPDSMEQANRARFRLAFDELFVLMARAQYQKHRRKTTQTAFSLPLHTSDLELFCNKLPFTLTDDQISSIDEILHDIKKPIPMNRLLEGDVGAGKTVVAAASMYAAIKNNHSAVLMAPTQILAEQHHASIVNLLSSFDIPVRLVIGGQKKSRSAPRTPSILIGTHALLTSGIIPKTTAFIVIDEQQRFGVAQRAKLRELSGTSNTPHQLIMTATPIPRTLAQTVFGDLDISTLTTLPLGRKPVRTWVVPNSKRNKAYAWIDKQIETSHGQAFVVCPLIDESESLTSVRAASSEYDTLKKVFAKRKLALLHGRLKPAEKTRILDAFTHQKTDILVSTPVVEVGIDIPNATIILIEAADRFGLSQLHQLRGRVGRRHKESYCLLFTENESEETLKRLKALETVHNGPELAELDLKLRGPGELFGTRQHGVSGLTLASLTDVHLLTRVNKAIKHLVQTDPSLSAFPYLRQQPKHDTIVAT